MQRDKLGIYKSLVQHLENFTPYLGLATCVYVTNPYLYFILSIVFDACLSYYFAPRETSLLIVSHYIYVDSYFPINNLLDTASTNKMSSTACTH